jgi:hypothetical protein
MSSHVGGKSPSRAPQAINRRLPAGLRGKPAHILWWMALKTTSGVSAE